ncbi:MAG: WD40 repeat domain-containing serine/threonine-protein kinase, partial [Fuerstiella sp.]
VAPSSILESSTDAPDDRQLKNLKFQTPLATTKNGFPDTLLGKGGMGSVFAATRECDGEVVALKHLNLSSATDPACLQRFQREAKIVASLDHPHIVPVYSVEMTDGSPTLVMKLIDGVTLSDVIADVSRTDRGVTTELHGWASVRRVATSLSQTPIETCLARTNCNNDYFTMVCRLMADVADAAQAAHQAGVVHRDIKPANLMLDLDGKVWLTDFGLASLDDDHSTLTATGDLLGTPAYMSPEQTRGETRLIDHRSDIYSMGATLYQLATLAKPFSGNRQQIMTDVALGNLTLPRRRRPDVPAPLEAIIRNAMSVRPGGRYQSAADFADDLRRFAAGRTVTAQAPGVVDRIMRWSWRHPRIAIGSVLGSLTTVLSIMFFQFVVAGQLAELNQIQTRTNHELNVVNEELERTNTDLTTSQHSLRHHLYVSDMSAAFRAFALGDVDTTRQLLERQTVGSLVAKPQPFEWRLLNTLAEPVQVRKLSVHTADALEIAYIPGTSQFVSVYADGVILRHDSESQRELSRFTIDGSLDAVAVSPDGNSFLVGQNVIVGINPVTLRDAKTGEVIREFTGHEYSVESAAFSPDGTMIATAGRYHDVLLHAMDGTLLHRINTRARNESLAFTADGQYLLTCVREQNPNAVAGNRQAVHAWRLADMQKAFELSPDFMVYTFATNQNLDSAARVFVANDDQVALYDLVNCTKLWSQKALRGRIRCVALSDDGTQAAAGCDSGLLYHWKLADQLDGSVDRQDKGSGPTVIDTGRGGITSLVFFGTDQMLLTKADGSVQLTELPIPNPWVRYTERVQWAVQSQVHPNRIFARLENGILVRFDQLVDEDHYAQARNPQRRKLAEPTMLMQAPVDYYGSFAVSRDDRILIASATQELIVISADTGEVLAKCPLPVENKLIRDLCFSHDQSRVFVLLSDRVISYSATDWKMLKEKILPNESAVRLVTSPTENSILVATTTELIQVPSDLNTIQRRHPNAHPLCSSVAYSPSGKLLIVGFADGMLEVRDAANWDMLATLRGHRGKPSSIGFLQNEQVLVTAGADHVIRFWDLNTHRELGVLFGDLEQVIMIEELDAIAAFGGSGSLQIFSVKPESWPSTGKTR